jgi:hypothetical protein
MKAKKQRPSLAKDSWGLGLYGSGYAQRFEQFAMR